MKLKLKLSALPHVILQFINSISSRQFKPSTNVLEQFTDPIVLPEKAKALSLWITKSELGDGGHPFKWRKYKPNVHNIKTKEDGLIIATYNCWRDRSNIKNRCNQLIKILLQSPADIFCLQETSPLIIRELIAAQGIMDKFIFCDISGYSSSVYSTHHKDGHQLTLFRRRYIKVYQAFNVPLIEQQHIVQCSVVAWNQPTGNIKTQILMIINVRFTADMNKTVLFQRLEDMLAQCHWHDGVIVLGDMSWNDDDDDEYENNYINNNNENNDNNSNNDNDNDNTNNDDVNQKFNWQDAAVRCQMDTLSTSSGLCIDFPHRPDRILFKNFPSSFLPIALNVFGKETIFDRRHNFNTFASTHLGVAAHFTFRTLP